LALQWALQWVLPWVLPWVLQLALPLALQWLLAPAPWLLLLRLSRTPLQPCPGRW
jgi:hypothetical protein